MPKPPTPPRRIPHKERNKGGRTRKHTKWDLTERQFNWCHAFLEGPPGIRLNAAKSYAYAFGWLKDIEADSPAKAWEKLKGVRKFAAGTASQVLVDMPKIQKYIEAIRRQIEMMTDQSRGSYVQKQIEMRDLMLEKESFAAARAQQRDIGEVLGHYTTRIEISEAPQSGDIITQIGELIKTHPELQRLAVSMIAESGPALKMLEQIEHPKVIDAEVRDVTPETPAAPTETPKAQETSDE